MHSNGIENLPYKVPARNIGKDLEDARVRVGPPRAFEPIDWGGLDKAKVAPSVGAQSDIKRKALLDILSQYGG